jgi:hypothetical protein
VNSRLVVLGEVAAERERQERKFPSQELTDGTGSQYRSRADAARAACDFAAQTGELTWSHILEEELAESLAEADPAALRVELMHTAAVAVRWIEAIDRRAAW